MTTSAQPTGEISDRNGYTGRHEGHVAALSLLLVEDDAASLELMSEVFLSLNADVCAISDSLEAAALVGKRKFDGIFLDLEMPTLNGLELAREIRRSSWNKSAPIVMVTGRDDRQTMQEAFSNGATFFLLKPVDRHKLTTLFRTVRGAMVDNRRRYLRAPLQTDLTCNCDSRILYGRTWNLSLGGLQVEVDGLKQGDAVRTRFQLPSSVTVIDAFGSVAWVRENRQGIRFTKLSRQNEDDIRSFIAVLDRVDDVQK